MEVEFSHEPTPEERQALLRALAGDGRRPEADRWWEEGVREAVETEPED